MIKNFLSMCMEFLVIFTAHSFTRLNDRNYHLLSSKKCTEFNFKIIYLELLMIVLIYKVSKIECQEAIITKFI